MERVLSILKECDIRNVLYYLAEGIPDKKYEKMLVRYYSLYCIIAEQWIPDKVRVVTISSFRQTGREHGNLAYRFLGISESSGMESFPEEPIKWEAFLKGEAEVLVPECVMDAVTEEQLTALIFWQLEKVCPRDIPIKRNEKLFESFRKYSQCGQNRLSAIAKIMEKALVYELDQKLVINEIREYRENKCLVVKWGDILENNEDPIPKGIMEQLKKSHVLVRQSFSRQLASESDDDVYRKFARLDPENTPDVCRCYRCINDFRSCYKEIGLSDYQYITEEHMRIIIEHNPSAPNLPIIYIRNKFGEKTEFSESELELSRLLCMDICVTDKKYKETDQILALLTFYREYPIRVKRIQREAMLLALTGMIYIKTKEEKGTNGEGKGDGV